MSAAICQHGLIGIRQDAIGLRELQQLSCQGLYASLVHVKSFLVRLVDGGISIRKKGQRVVMLRQGADDVC